MSGSSSTTRMLTPSREALVVASSFPWRSVTAEPQITHPLGALLAGAVTRRCAAGRSNTVYSRARVEIETDPGPKLTAYAAALRHRREWDCGHDLCRDSSDRGPDLLGDAGGPGTVPALQPGIAPQIHQAPTSPTGPRAHGRGAPRPRHRTPPPPHRDQPRHPRQDGALR